tara:strand:- start:641 stop:1468 length:828 start_codon:yes stop_codon:yes gene_type:complete
MTRAYFQDLDRDADLSGFLVVEPKADGCFGLLSSDGTVTSRNDTTLGRIDLKTGEDFVLVGEYLIRTPWSVETGRTGTFLAFDILVDQGVDVSGLPLVERKRRLEDVVGRVESEAVDDFWHGQPVPLLGVLPWFVIGEEVSVFALWETWVLASGWEGLVFKSAGAYGDRWGRMKRVHERDFVLVDFEEPKVDAHVGHLVGSAVIGHYVDGELVTIGKVSAGFDHETRREMYLDPDAFIGRVMKVRGNSVFRSGAMRHPVFNGWHADKAAEDCVPC